MPDSWTLDTPDGPYVLNQSFTSPKYEPGGIAGPGVLRRDDRTAYQRSGDGLRTPGTLTLIGRVWRDDHNHALMVSELNAIRDAVSACTSVTRTNNAGTYTYDHLAGGATPEITPDGLGGWLVKLNLWPGRPDAIYVSRNRPYLHFRLLFRTNHGHNNNQITQLILRTEPGGPQIAVGGIATASSENSATYGPDRAFNDVPTEYWAGGNYTAFNSWLAYELPEAKPVDEYEIRGSGTLNVNALPKEWKLQGSMDGITWDDLDHRRQEPPWGPLPSARVYTPVRPTPNPNAFRHIRWRVTANNGDARTGTRHLLLRTEPGGPQEAIAYPIAAGTAAASSRYSSQYRAELAFVAAMPATHGWLSSGGPPQWISFDFGEAWPKQIVQYGVGIPAPSNPANKAARDWVLEASHDGLSWVPIDTQTGQTGWAPDEQRFFNI